MLILLATPTVRAAEPSTPSRLAVGVNVTGGQLDLNLDQRWRAEARYVTGRQGSDSGTITSSAAGLRGYRLFGGPATHPFLGAEAAYVRAKQGANGFKVSGMAFGGFIGIEHRIGGRLWVGVDAGPYVFALKESTTRSSDNNLEFVLNSYAMFYLF